MRIWQEGFESGLPHGFYNEGVTYSQYFNDLSLSHGIGKYTILSNGRNAYSQKSLALYSQYYTNTLKNVYAMKIFDSSYSELYIRFYFSYDFLVEPYTTGYPIFQVIDSIGNILFEIENNTNTTNITFDINVRKNSILTNVASKLTSKNVWYKVDVYFKCNATTGAYDVKFDDVSIFSETNIDTGTNNISALKFQALVGVNGPTYYSPTYFDDIAVNDTYGTKNNSWCGAGTILSLKPKGAGNKSQWSTSQGWVLAENGTSTTNIEITSHGLATGDVIYNVTRDTYRIITKVDDNNFTVTSVTSQTENDIIIAFTNIATITAGTGTSTSQVVLSGHNLESYDVFVNTTRSNAIRRVIRVSGVTCINSEGNNVEYIGSTVSSQASGDSIKTFKVKQYPISDHYKAFNKAAPNPLYSNIQSQTLNQIDTFDMEELIADKGLPTNTKIITAAVKVYAKEKGAGSQYQPVLRIDGADYTGSTVSLVGGTLEYSTIFEDSPDTETQFTLSEIDNIEAGVKVV